MIGGGDRLVEEKVLGWMWNVLFRDKFWCLGMEFSVYGGFKEWLFFEYVRVRN